MPLLERLHVAACILFWGMILAAPLIGWRLVSGTWDWAGAGTLKQWEAMAAAAPLWLADLALYGRWQRFYERRAWSSGERTGGSIPKT